MLPIAAQSNDIPTVREVLTLGSQPTALDKTQLRRTFYYAAAYNHVAILNMLRQKTGLDMNSPCDSDQNSMLCLACREGHTEAVMELLDDPRVNVNYANKEGQTPLMLACTSECTTTNWDLFSALLKRGANPLSPEGKPILALAMVYNNEAAINAINAFQPSPTIKDDDSILKRCLTKAYGHFFPAPISLQPQVSSPMDKPSI